MKYVFLDGNKILSNADLHRVFAETLDFPEYYGSNLDALHDCLSEVSDNICVVAVNVDLLSEHVGRRWKSFLRLMDDLTKDDPGFRFLPEPFGKDRPAAEDT